jgi:anaerobic selenocysteine-containing dehydrogenase
MAPMPDSTTFIAIHPTHDVIGACPHDCPDTCSLVTTVQDGVATKVHGNPAHPHTDGALCTKVSRYTERTYHPERILHPLKRTGPKGSGQFERVSWEAALADIAARLSTIAARGPDAAQAILPYSYAGTMGLVQSESIAARFFNQLGASFLNRTICATAGGTGLTHTLGGKVGMRVEFFAESKLIIIWGSNSITSNLHFWRYAQVAKRNGAKLICIDPRKSETADKCHEHIALLPGTDAALALAVMHELIATTGWTTTTWRTTPWAGTPCVRGHCSGHPNGRRRCVALPCEQITSPGPGLRRVRDAQRPAAIRLNYGLQRVRGGGNAVRAIACLPALTGAWRHRAGGVLLSSSGQFPVARAALERPDLLAGRTPRTINMVTIGDDLLRPASPEFGPAIEALVVYNSNPVAVAPDSSKVVQGFAREDLFTVVLEHFQTDTADYADYILPATTQLEHWDVHLSLRPHRCAAEPPGHCPGGRGQAQYADFPRAGGPHGFYRPVFLARRRKPVPYCLWIGSGFRCAAAPGFCPAQNGRRTVCPRRLSYPLRSM